ncbi:hypothetical protein ACFYR1_05170 [Streptomyces canus]|uniref:hypothetical protein n=1 Tax=Streptomyces canus TaxID=58343 RepID=UPI0036ADE4A5
MAQADGTVVTRESQVVAQIEDGTTTAVAPRQQPKRQTKAQRRSGGPRQAGDGTSASTAKQPQKPGSGSRSEASSGQRSSAGNCLVAGLDWLYTRLLRRAQGAGHKQALLDAVALTGFERLLEISTAAQQRAGESFAEQLDAVARAFVDFALANAELRFTQQVVDMIVEGPRRGEVRKDRGNTLPCPSSPSCAAMPGWRPAARCRPRPPNTVWTT